MREFKNNDELKALIKDGVIKIKDSIRCRFDIDVNANIDCYHIEAYDIKSHNIKAIDIKAHDIKAHDIKAHNIEAHNIEAHNLDAYNIEVKNISYYVFCIANESFKCESVKGRRGKQPSHLFRPRH